MCRLLKILQRVLSIKNSSLDSRSTEQTVETQVELNLSYLHI